MIELWNHNTSPKAKDASRIKQFHPTCLLNCLYKWFTKNLTLRFEPVAARIIHKDQTTFIQGRNIMDGVLSLHEILYETKRRRKGGVVFKLDFEKSIRQSELELPIEMYEIKGLE
jgi:hypothetical protein